jgi:hypothetical protein
MLCVYTEGLSEEVTVETVDALFTVWLTAAEVLVVKFVLPKYCAVIECVPTAKDDRLSVAVAVPDEFDSTLLPSRVAPSKNFTVPLGVWLNCGLTVAVNVTDWPKTDGFGVIEDTVVMVLAFETTCVNTVEVLLLTFESPR